ncbi:MAG: hypothetical protein KFB95_04395 [Simkaniaceae bacterium]|nr:MAG: hypothetical protein KFB95_04395 [Simkaniaceae bacterium]
MSTLFSSVIFLLCGFFFPPSFSFTDDGFPITHEWWTCSCGHSNPAGTVRCEICGKHKS